MRLLLGASSRPRRPARARWSSRQTSPRHPSRSTASSTSSTPVSPPSPTPRYPNPPSPTPRCPNPPSRLRQAEGVQRKGRHGLAGGGADLAGVGAAAVGARRPHPRIHVSQPALERARTPLHSAALRCIPLYSLSSSLLSSRGALNTLHTLASPDHACYSQHTPSPGARACAAKSKTDPPPVKT